ncbi:MAG: CBS domain-containing protein [Thermoanaerobaculia bacterium]|nr:CBS domain-containing protein [Thermoanaerobaculia bacterium]
MKTVRDLLEQKGSDVWSIGPRATVYEALQLMADKGIGAVLVLEEGRVVGILSERDYARKVVLMERSSRDTPVEQIMSPDPVCVGPDETIDECLAIMTARRFRHLPVLDGDRLLGVVSIGDAVKGKIDDLEFVNRQLESYIKGQ